MKDLVWVAGPFHIKTYNSLGIRDAIHYELGRVDKCGIYDSRFIRSNMLKSNPMIVMFRN